MNADRTPLSAQVLRERLVHPAGPYAALDVVETTGSTNADLVAAARAGAQDRTVLIAEEQTAGRGRHTRHWVSPPHAGLYLSVLWRPVGVPVARLSWLLAIGGAVLARVVREVSTVDAVLKWPNDLLVGPSRHKCGGILAEAAGGTPEPAVVLGIGLNVNHTAAELPAGPGGLPATSLALQHASSLDREHLAIALLQGLAEAERQWREHGGDPVSAGLDEEYRRLCATIGQRVRVELPAIPGRKADLVGTAVDIDRDGRLVIETAGGRQAISAGDVVHLRAVTSADSCGR